MQSGQTWELPLCDVMVACAINPLSSASSLEAVDCIMTIDQASQSIIKGKNLSKKGQTVGHFYWTRSNEQVSIVHHLLLILISNTQSGTQPCRRQEKQNLGAVYCKTSYRFYFLQTDLRLEKRLLFRLSIKQATYTQLHRIEALLIQPFEVEPSGSEKSRQIVRPKFPRDKKWPLYFIAFKTSIKMTLTIPKSMGGSFLSQIHPSAKKECFRLSWPWVTMTSAA